MKKLISGFVLAVIFSLIFSSCSSSVDNSITFKNIAAASVIVNFRGELITVGSQKTSAVKDIPRGTFSYNTTYSVPSGTLTSTAVGDVSGDVTVKAGTKILVLYSSTLINGTYSLYANISSSDSLETTTQP